MAGYLTSNTSIGQTTNGVSTKAGHDSFVVSGYTRALKQGISRVASCPVASTDKAKAVAAARAARKAKVETAKTIKDQQDQIDELQTTVKEIVEVLNNANLSGYPSNTDGVARTSQITTTNLTKFKS